MSEELRSRDRQRSVFSHPRELRLLYHLTLRVRATNVFYGMSLYQTAVKLFFENKNFHCFPLSCRRSNLCIASPSVGAVFHGSYSPLHSQGSTRQDRRARLEREKGCRFCGTPSANTLCVRCPFPFALSWRRVLAPAEDCLCALSDLSFEA